VWSAAITGNIVVIGTDPTYHSTFNGMPQGGNQVAQSGIAFAAADDQAGAYITLSCYYDGAPPNAPVPLLDQFGAFTVQSAACWNAAHIVASHDALAGLTDASLSNWSCSSHEVFNSFPANFLPLVIAEEYNCPSPPGTGQHFGDGTCGTPYVLARGEELVPAACGDGTVNPEIGEQCDDGNTANGDGCSAQCQIEVPRNTPPVCTDAAPTVASIWPPNHKMVGVGITGVTDADGDPVTITITSIMQDEPTNTIGDGNTSCDASGVGGPVAEVRAERSGSNSVPGDGRFYHIFFTADDGAGGTCSGSVSVAVPHDQSNAPVDGGALYNSCTP
jgi:cysteine-rich repeat protein